MRLMKTMINSKVSQVRKSFFKQNFVHTVGTEIVNSNKSHEISNRKKFKTPRPEASQADGQDCQKSIVAKNISGENSVITAENNPDAIENQQNQSSRNRNLTVNILSQPGKQDNSGFSFYRLDDSLFVHGSRGNIAQSPRSSTNNKQNQNEPS